MAKVSATNLQKAKVQLLLAHPFFGSLVMRHPVVETERIPTMAVNKAGEILANPKFVADKTVSELVFLVAHEVMHVVYAHLSRLNGRDPFLWNVACDATINELLVKEGIGTFPAGGVRMEGAETKTADYIYNQLLQEAEKNGQSSSGGDGDGDGEGQDQDCDGDGDSNSLSNGSYRVHARDLLPEEAKGITEGEARQMATQGKIEISASAQAARMQGKLSGGLAGIIDNIIASKVPWYTVLEKYMVGKAEQHQNWQHPNKRYAGRYYLPRRERFPSMGEVVVGIDTSGSISDKEMAEFIGHLNGIIEQCHPSAVHVLYVTTEVEHSETYERSDYPIPAQKNRWCGGTDMCAIHQWVDDNDVEPDVVVVLSDMYTPFPDKVDVDTVWVSTTDMDAPANLGPTLHVNEED